MTTYKWIAQDSDGCIAKYIDKPRIDGCQFLEFPIEVIQKTTFIRVKGWENSLINLETHNYKIEDGILMKVEKENIYKGTEMQYRYANCNDTWTTLHDKYEFRIKPKTKNFKFRNYIDTDGVVHVTTEDIVGKWCKWIGDLQEVEIEQ